jgi:hypothetical protein
MSKMTDWFPSSIKPVRAGVYEVYTPNCIANKYAYFDKKGWRLCASDTLIAKMQKNNPDTFRESSMTLSYSKWRGFTEKQQ